MNNVVLYIIVGLLIVAAVLIALGLTDIILADRRQRKLNDRLNNLRNTRDKRTQR